MQESDTYFIKPKFLFSGDTVSLSLNKISKQYCTCHTFKNFRFYWIFWWANESYLKVIKLSGRVQLSVEGMYWLKVKEPEDLIEDSRIQCFSEMSR